MHPPKEYSKSYDELLHITRGHKGADMQIDAHKRPMEDILKLGQHIIPRYQRRYAWEEQNIRDFWTDITGAKEPHFLGSMVVSGQSSSPKEVIDGQQRLTTTLIALTAIRELYTELGNEARVTGITPYIEFVDKDGRSQYRLRNRDENADNRLKDCSLIPKALQPPSRRGDEESRESKAFALFTELIRERMAAAENSLEALDLARDSILGTEVVYINVEDRRNAFTIFETLNDRGQSLTVIDLIKNLLFSHITEGSADSAERLWSETIELIEECSLENITPDFFLYYYWNSRAVTKSSASDYIEQFRIRRSISEFLDSRTEVEEAARALVTDIRDAAAILTALDQTLMTSGAPDPWRGLAKTWRRDKYEEIARLLYGTLVTGANQPLPLLMALLRTYHQTKNPISNKILKEFLTAIRNFQFRWTIAQKTSTSTMRRLYRAASFKVDSAKSGEDYSEALKEFIDGAARIDASDTQFKDGLARLAYSRTRNKDVHKVRYILTSLERHMGDSKMDLSLQMSIEHLQGTAGRSEATPRNFWIFKLGNLALLPAPVNAQLPTDFAEKSATLRQWINDKDLVLHEALKSGEWNNSGFGKRQEQLAEMASAIWPPLNDL